MPQTIMVFVCPDLPNAAAAKKFLKKKGFAEDDITVEEAASFTYDAAKFGNLTGKDDFAASPVVVTGRKP